MRALVRGVLGAGAACLIGCLPPTVVERAYGGDVVAGRYVSPQAYAAYLRGALAAAAHRTDEAVQAYERAARLDPRSPEPWTRIAEVLCETGGTDERAGAAVARALALDPDDGGAWAARARCAALRGDMGGEREAAGRAARLGDPSALILAPAQADADPRAAREELVALTLGAPEPVVAWSALVSWAEAHGDVALWTRGLLELVRIAPERRSAIAKTAEEMAGAGLTGEARTVAAAVVDSTDQPLLAGRTLAARLAVDEAIARGDMVALRRRASRARLRLDEAAARALLAGRASMARDIAADVVAADPGSLGSRVVLAAADHGDLAAAATARPGDVPASAAAFVVLVREAIRAEPRPSVATMLAAVPHAPLLAGDARVVRPAVELALHGALEAEWLPPDGAIELAILQGKAPPLPEPGAVDVRYRYLALAASQPASEETRALASRLRALAPHDTIVVAADALVQLASGGSPGASASGLLLAHDPGDPLLAAVALRVAEKTGDADAARRARETLTALGASRRTAR